MAHRPRQPACCRPPGRHALQAAAAMLVAALGACQVAPLGPGLIPEGAAAPAAPASAVAAASAAPAPVAVASAPAIVPTPAVPGLLDLLDRPAERALLAGLRAYDDGQYTESETQLRRAVDGNLRSTRDRLAAHKQLAFIYCTTARPTQCEAEFRAALKVDASFSLTRGEAGHPMWGPVYKRVKSP